MPIAVLTHLRLLSNVIARFPSKLLLVITRRSTQQLPSRATEERYGDVLLHFSPGNLHRDVLAGSHGKTVTSKKVSKAHTAHGCGGIHHAMCNA